MKKAISTLLVASMCAATLAGCGGNANTSANTDNSSTENTVGTEKTEKNGTADNAAEFENKKLNIAVFEGGYGPDYWNEIVEKFEVAYPGVEVDMQISPSIGDVIRPQIVAGNVPDFIVMNDNDSTGLISSLI